MRFSILEKALREKTGINTHQGKTKLWNKGGFKQSITDALPFWLKAISCSRRPLLLRGPLVQVLERFVVGRNGKQQIHHCPHGLMGASLVGVQFQVVVIVNMLWLSGPVQTPTQVGGWLFLPIRQAVGRGCEWLVSFNKHHKHHRSSISGKFEGDKRCLLNIMQMKVIILLMMGATLTWKRGGVRRKQVEMMNSWNPQTMNEHQLKSEALRLALREITESEEDHARSNRGKLLMLPPRMLLC